MDRVNNIRRGPSSNNNSRRNSELDGVQSGEDAEHFDFLRKDDGISNAKQTGPLDGFRQAYQEQLENRVQDKRTRPNNEGAAVVVKDYAQQDQAFAVQAALQEGQELLENQRVYDGKVTNDAPDMMSQKICYDIVANLRKQSNQTRVEAEHQHETQQRGGVKKRNAGGLKSEDDSGSATMQGGAAAKPLYYYGQNVASGKATDARGVVSHNFQQSPLLSATNRLLESSCGTIPGASAVSLPQQIELSSYADFPVCQRQVTNLGGAPRSANIGCPGTNLNMTMGILCGSPRHGGEENGHVDRPSFRAKRATWTLKCSTQLRARGMIPQKQSCRSSRTRTPCRRRFRKAHG
jgi:hypothetical protein